MTASSSTPLNGALDTGCHGEVKGIGTIRRRMPFRIAPRIDGDQMPAGLEALIYAAYRKETEVDGVSPLDCPSDRKIHSAQSRTGWTGQCGWHESGFRICLLL